jgi:sugar phosphate isomerase/epimerase
MIELAMLTEMMAPDLEDSIRQLGELGITRLDLKGGVFGKSVEDLDETESEKLARLLIDTGTTAYCFSSVLGHWNVSGIAEAEFRRNLMDGVKRLVRTTRFVRPKLVRLLGCTFDGRAEFSDANEYLEKKAQWVYEAYREAVDCLAGRGLTVTIENEPGSIFGNPAETVGFFERLDRPGKAFFTWDIQNMWQSDTYPTVEIYETLRPVVNYVHLKGGKGTPENPTVMKYRSLLEDAGWPVREIVQRVIDDGTSPVLCLNCSHGAPADDYPLRDIWGTPEVAAEEAKRDVKFLRERFSAIA